MVLLLGLAALIWGLGGWMGVPRATRLGALGALYGAGLIAASVLPVTHPLRQSLGGSPAPLLVLAIVVALILTYRNWIKTLRKKANAAAAEPRPPAAPQPDIARHARHLMLRDIGGAGQARLGEARVLVIGAGGLGLPAAAHLHAAGLGTVGLIDPDRVEISNLPRQILYSADNVGTPKVEAAFGSLSAQNPNGTLRPYHRRFEPEIAADLFADYDLVLEGSDSFATKQLANRTAFQTNTPLILAALSPWEAQMMRVMPGQNRPCYACLFPTEPDRDTAPSCAEAGVVAPLPHLVGAAMALEAIKHLTGADQALAGGVWSFDGRQLESQFFRAQPDPNCPVCGRVL